MSEQYQNLLLPPNALPSIDVKVFSSRLRPSRHSLLLNSMEEDPVFLLGIYARSSGKQLWRLEKTIHSLPVLHQSVKASCDFDGKLPDKSLFSGHAPARIDARRAALNAYFDLLLDTPLSERAALAVCEFFSTNVLSAEEDHSPISTHLAIPGMVAPTTSVATPPYKEGYLTKRGKNFGGWKARYFMLDGPELKYYDAQNGPQIGVIKLYKAQIGKQSQQASHDPSGKEEEADNQYRHAFLILEPKRKDSSSLVRHVLCAESDEERDAWVSTLLKYVDHKDGKPIAQAATKEPPEVREPVTPKPKRRGPARPDRLDVLAKDGDNSDSEAGELLVQGTSYENTVQGDLPVQGTTVSHYGASRSIASPSLNGNFSGMFSSQQNQRNTISISGPTNGSVIQDTGNWGLSVKTPVKEKKRSIFGFHRARTPSDTTSGQSSTSSSVLAPERKAPLLRPVFGMPLAEAVETAPPGGVNVRLPAVVYRCIEYLEAQGAASEEGIFRLSGSQNVIKGLRERFNNEGDVRLLDGNYYDVHAVASLLKLYLRELPSSVLTRDLHLDFLKSLEIEEKEQKITAINVLVHMLPPVNLELLSNLCSYLADVANASDINKMNVRNGK
jgi:RalA-binding protein 1